MPQEAPIASCRGGTRHDEHLAQVGHTRGAGARCSLYTNDIGISLLYSFCYQYLCCTSMVSPDPQMMGVGLVLCPIQYSLNVDFILTKICQNILNFMIDINEKLFFPFCRAQNSVCILLMSGVQFSSTENTSEDYSIYTVL